MKKMKTLLCALLLTLAFNQSFGQSYTVNKEDITVQLNGNAYVSSGNRGATISEEGLTDWTDQSAVVSTYIYFEKPQTFNL